MDDQISVAQKLGLDDHVKNLRGQQDVELRRDSEERRAKTDERRWDITQKFNEERAKYQDRMAGAAEARMGRMESRQGAQMDKAELNSTRQSLTSVLKDIASEESRIDLALGNGMATPEQIKEYGRQREILARDRIGAKNQLLSLSGVDMTVGQKEPARFPTPPQAALDLLAKTPDSRAQFEAKYGPAPATQEPPRNADKKEDSPAPKRPSTPKDDGPTYAKFMAAKERRDEINSTASKMSAGQRESYLQSRLPQVEAEIEANKNYRTY
jgi:hypothetical protein